MCGPRWSQFLSWRSMDFTETTFHDCRGFVKNMKSLLVLMPVPFEL